MIEDQLSVMHPELGLDFVALPYRGAESRAEGELEKDGLQQTIQMLQKELATQNASFAEVSPSSCVSYAAFWFWARVWEAGRRLCRIFRPSDVA